MSISPSVCGIKYIIKNNQEYMQDKVVNGKQPNDTLIDIIKTYISGRTLTHFVNIGAHIGTLCLPVSLHIEKVTAIEAYQPTYLHLLENIQLNNIINVSVHNVAIGNTEGPIYFMSETMICPVERVNRYINNTGGMHVYTEEDIQKNIRSSALANKTATGIMTKLDTLEIGAFDILAVDIEGGEYEFLLGATETLKKYKPIIIIEIWDNRKRQKENMPTTRENIIDYVVSLKYKLIQNLGDDFIFEPLTDE